MVTNWETDRTCLEYLLLLFSHSVVSDSLQHHGPQHTRLPCPSLSPGVCSDSCPLSQWCHLTISSSIIPFSSCLQSFPTSGGQSTGASASASVSSMNSQGWFPLGLTGLISLQSKGLWRVFPTRQFRSISSSALSLLYGPVYSSVYLFIPSS